MGREDFLVSPSNADAVAWIDKWPDWPGPALVLVGPAGCGKTHLGQVWREQSGASEFDPSDDRGIAEPGGSVFVDTPEDEAADEQIFHLYNAASAAGNRLLIATRTSPAQWENRLPDLKSRLAAAPNIRIHGPDETLIAAVMVKMFADQQLDVGADVLSYLVNRMERSFEAARMLVERMNDASLAAKRGITIPWCIRRRPQSVVKTDPVQMRWPMYFFHRAPRSPSAISQNRIQSTNSVLVPISVTHTSVLVSARPGSSCGTCLPVPQMTIFARPKAVIALIIPTDR